MFRHLSDCAYEKWLPSALEFTRTNYLLINTTQPWFKLMVRLLVADILQKTYVKTLHKLTKFSGCKNCPAR